MVSVTKIFRFEMGHAIDEYEGMCKFIHGHSYILHVTVALKNQNDGPIKAPGFVIDFKELKKIVNEKVINRLDHALVLSENYLKKHSQNNNKNQNIFIWPYEPSAENILFFIREELKNSFDSRYQLLKLQLWETSDSFATWEAPPMS